MASRMTSSVSGRRRNTPLPRVFVVGLHNCFGGAIGGRPIRQRDDHQSVYIWLASRRPAWENAPTSFIKDLATYRVHGVQWCARSFRHLAENGVTTESRVSRRFQRRSLASMSSMSFSISRSFWLFELIRSSTSEILLS
jgi:hypothetical protein